MEQCTAVRKGAFCFHILALNSSLSYCVWIAEHNRLLTEMVPFCRRINLFVQMKPFAWVQNHTFFDFRRDLHLNLCGDHKTTCRATQVSTVSQRSYRSRLQKFRATNFWEVYGFLTSECPDLTDCIHIEYGPSLIDVTGPTQHSSISPKKRIRCSYESTFRKKDYITFFGLIII